MVGSCLAQVPLQSLGQFGCLPATNSSVNAGAARLAHIYSLCTGSHGTGSLHLLLVAQLGRLQGSARHNLRWQQLVEQDRLIMTADVTARGAIACSALPCFATRHTAQPRFEPLSCLMCRPTATSPHKWMCGPWAAHCEYQVIYLSGQQHALVCSWLSIAAESLHSLVIPLTVLRAA